MQSRSAFHLMARKLFAWLLFLVNVLFCLFLDFCFELVYLKPHAYFSGALEIAGGTVVQCCLLRVQKWW